VSEIILAIIGLQQTPSILFALGSLAAAAVTTGCGQTTTTTRVSDTVDRALSERDIEVLHNISAVAFESEYPIPGDFCDVRVERRPNPKYNYDDMIVHHIVHPASQHKSVCKHMVSGVGMPTPGAEGDATPEERTLHVRFDYIFNQDPKRCYAPSGWTLGCPAFGGYFNVVMTVDVSNSLLGTIYRQHFSGYPEARISSLSSSGDYARENAVANAAGFVRLRQILEYVQ
jgi:hypothetical protein